MMIESECLDLMATAPAVSSGMRGATPRRMKSFQPIDPLKLRAVTGGGAVTDWAAKKRDQIWRALTDWMGYVPPTVY